VCYVVCSFFFLLLDLPNLFYSSSPFFYCIFMRDSSCVTVQICSIPLSFLQNPYLFPFFRCYHSASVFCTVGFFTFLYPSCFFAILFQVYHLSGNVYALFFFCIFFTVLTIADLFICELLVDYLFTILMIAVHISI
jgi:hypothetical protein